LGRGNISGVLASERNIILIGMPGVGKSTVGVLLAKATRRGFVDTDLLIQAGEGLGLQEIIDTRGLEAFCRIEQDYLLCLGARGQVIATGGSAVYSEPAMLALRDTGPVVHLELPLELLERRLADQATRGIVMAPGQTLEGLYRQRRPLYARWADLSVDCTGKTQDQVTAEVQLRTADLK
jgi:shikimate kinase